MGKQRVVLKNRADVTLVGRLAIDQGAAEPDFTGGGLLKPGDQAERCGFSAAGRAEERKKASLRDLERDPVDRRMSRILFRQVAEFEAYAHWKKYSKKRRDSKRKSCGLRRTACFSPFLRPQYS